METGRGSEGFGSLPVVSVAVQPVRNLCKTDKGCETTSLEMMLTTCGDRKAQTKMDGLLCEWQIEQKCLLRFAGGSEAGCIRSQEIEVNVV
jgi:hypothetical protein